MTAPLALVTIINAIVVIIAVTTIRIISGPGR
jgi:hypothetical protein